MHLHILGICGTFMGGLAAIAKSAGHAVTGCDANVYPPMSTQLEALGIGLTEGWDPAQLTGVARDADVFVIGNVVSRGNPLMESILNAGSAYVSGPQWLYEHVLADRWVLAVAGTHGKTSTTAMLAWILEDAGLDPGFLIGGVPQDFDRSARLTDSTFFVIEADEYDTAFFDKRAKFVHYRPDIAILNNLEYDHADIYPDIASIQTQFHHLVRTIPGKGTIVSNAADDKLEAVLDRGCWSQLQRFSLNDVEAEWQVEMIKPGGNELSFKRAQQPIGQLLWSMQGRHNALNACAAIAACVAAGVNAASAINHLSRFRGVKRRMELVAEIGGVHIYDDFAHHPTAIRLTLEGLRRNIGNARLLVALEPRSNTMRAGIHIEELGPALIAADRVWLKAGEGINWDPQEALAPLEGRGRVVTKTEDMLQHMVDAVKAGDHVVFMSNGGFEAATQRFCQQLGTGGQ